MRLLWRTVLLDFSVFRGGNCPGRRAASALGADPRSICYGQRWYAAFSPVFRSTLNAGSAKRISIYEEHLKISAASAARNTMSFCAIIFARSFSGRPIGLLVAQGLFIIAGLCVALPRRSFGLGCLWFAEIIRHLGGLLRKKSQFDLQKFDLNDAVRGALNLLDHEASNRGVVLGVSQAQAALPVRADEVHLQQVILNLAMNVNGCDAELRSRLAANDIGNRAGRGSRGGSVGCRFRHRHSETTS